MTAFRNLTTFVISTSFLFLFMPPLFLQAGQFLVELPLQMCSRSGIGQLAGHPTAWVQNSVPADEGTGTSLCHIPAAVHLRDVVP